MSKEPINIIALDEKTAKEIISTLKETNQVLNRVGQALENLRISQNFKQAEIKTPVKGTTAPKEEPDYSKRERTDDGFSVLKSGWDTRCEVCGAELKKDEAVEWRAGFGTRCYKKHRGEEK